MLSVSRPPVSWGRPRKTIRGRSNSTTKEAWRPVRCIKASRAAELWVSIMAVVGSWTVGCRERSGSAKVIVVLRGKVMA
ncbi:hypothetical protein G6F31_021768 [Rhizopus arrhizus]|nr:hypothetical protein G6F31_021768 [Rhizopus arrhizus]